MAPEAVVAYNKGMSLQFATKDEIAEWDNLLAKNPDGGSPFQIRELGELKKRGGWLPRYVYGDGIAILVLEKYVFPLGHMWYIPKGPGVQTVTALEKVLHELRELAQTCSVFAIKIEPELIDSPETIQALKAAGLSPAPAIQPNTSTIVLDLTGGEEATMARFGQTARRMIRSAQKDGATVQPVTASDENCRIMYDLYQETAAGQFSLRSYEYYRAFWQACEASGNGQLFFATVDGTTVAGVFVLFVGAKAVYKDGASTRSRTARGVGHLIQWEVIRFLIDRGITSYDLHGTPAARDLADTTHPKHRLGVFKTSFSKDVIDYVGAWDLPVRPLAARFWQRYSERIARRLSMTLKHEDWY